MKCMKESIEFAHAEVKDLKKGNEEHKISEELMKQRLEKLEKENDTLHKSVIDLKASAMRDNLVFYNLPENKDENTTEIVLKTINDNLGMDMKIDRSHRLGKPRQDATKLRPIVAKFNYYQDREQILKNAQKLQGTKIGIGEQFPDEILRIRKELYPELKKARDAGKKAKLLKTNLLLRGKYFTSRLRDAKTKYRISLHFEPYAYIYCVIVYPPTISVKNVVTPRGFPLHPCSMW